jgi:hypothetical protein
VRLHRGEGLSQKTEYQAVWARYWWGVETAGGGGGNIQWDEGYVVVEGVGGANPKIAQGRGLVSKIRISSCMGSILAGGKRNAAGRVVETHNLLSVQ